MSVLGYRSKKSVNILDKTIPRNHKFDDVQSKLDTGKHKGNVTKKWDTSGEIFERIGRNKLYQLLCVDPRDNNNNIYDDDRRSVLEMQINEEGVEVLLVDIRTPEEYNSCHIDGAINYPAIMLRRDRWIPELFEYRNKANRIIVLYDNDSKSPLGIETTTTFIRKRWDNVKLLHLGLYGFIEKFPEITFGNIEIPEPNKKIRRKPSRRKAARNR